MKYKIVRWADASHVEREVNEMLSQGWQLTGGLVFDGRCYSQAMFIKY